MIKKYLDKNIKELLEKSFIAFFFRILGVFITFLFTIVITKYYGTSVLGEFFLFITIVSIASTLSIFGLDTSLLKLFQKNYDKKKLYIKSILIAIVMAILISSIIYFNLSLLSSSLFNNKNLENYFKYLPIIIVPFVIAKINSTYLRASKNIKSHIFVESINVNIFTLIFIYISSFTLIESYAISIFLNFIISYYFLNRIIINCKDNRTIPISKIMKESYPMIFTTMLAMSINWVDTIMIGIYMDEFYVGLYTVVTKLANFTLIIVGAVNTISAPQIAYIFYHEINKFTNFIRKITFLIVVLTIPVIGTLIFFSNDILLYYSKEYLNFENLIYILVFAQVINILTGPVRDIMNMTGKQFQFTIIMFNGALINLTFNYLLVNQYGIYGIILSTSLAITVINISSLIYVQKKHKIYR